MFSKLRAESAIVIIDDVPANLYLLDSCLRALGLSNIHTFIDSAQGLEWLLEHPWELLLLDLQMPPPDGFEILDSLQSRNRSESQVVMVTGSKDAQNRRKCLEKGANDFISKPIDLPEVLLRVRNCLESSQAARLLRQANADLEHKVELRTVQLEASRKSLVNCLSRVAGYREWHSRELVERIGESSARLAEAIGMPGGWCERIRLAAPLRDLGKIGIDDALLHATRPLTPEEHRQVQAHTRRGYEILLDHNGSPLTDMAAEIALAHHECWDGSGYPAGLKREEIALSARIVAICDAYHTLTTPGPGRAARSRQHVLGYIREQMGIAFDPQLASCFCNLLDGAEP
ncbi:two-component system response regulator [Pseudomonas sp. TKO26]|nr:two-component system response regulator [Pseudomonas sp. TKO30]PYY86758.1 two-component system response regulator [Pseudomonas sp. TKO29]PYY89401.1 two-component system response regulator [Pseudomonas sp. TKO26]PYY99230.1 two-component system response regulator [Pseudomonas sp. TKO14]